ncbi:molecular chaperone TorD family protein [Neobacillus novalis]|uniref:Molecular chaperone TorD family protein n=1 Tax=Neobacillus novalis TaxID=220687 RepID=A0AA95MVJ6_9BACI|nr:molecular chaperone TorD family protein [Neobacillus novalis]WHY88885.1 molecular chaperone TorD family protein [Neobacillus novalis]
MIYTEINNINQEERLFMYQLFLHYYRGDLLKLPSAEWGKLLEMLERQHSLQSNDWGRKAIQQLQNLTDQALETFEFDFNRLFVGPNKLLASPFESSYQNFEGTVMQAETLKVRRFYYYEGLQVANEGGLPDDHIQFELEFILHLLGSEDKNKVLQLFLEKHLLKWVDQHWARIEEHSQNQITLAFGYLLKGFILLEKSLIEGEGPLC